MDSTKKTARLAGLLYLASSIPGVFALLYVPEKLVVRGDAAATADRIRASGTLLRMGIGAEVLSFTLFIFVALVLYRLFKPVSAGPALWMVVLILLSTPISFLGIVNEVAALKLVGAAGGVDFLSALDAHQRDALAYLFLSLHGQGFLVAQVFWGLWLFPLALLIYKSRFLPRFLGVWLALAGFAWIILSLTSTLWPLYQDKVNSYLQPAIIGEIVFMLWLLIKGANPQIRNSAAS